MEKYEIHIPSVENFLRFKSRKDANELINYYKSSDIKLEEIAYLANRLAFSGNTLDFEVFRNIADIASTGGPTSLSTLLCPLYLTKFGYKVLSLGVPGRPAGGIDVLAQIPQYRVELNEIEIRNCLKYCGYAHFLANEDYAPADAILFKVRQEMNAQTIPPLVIASLLSKKIAVGVKILGLDIRISPHGNFGRNWEEGQENARLFCEVAKLVGINAKCFLTDARLPFQPYVGRSEALLALSNLFANKAEDSLIKHSELCSKMAYSLLQSGKIQDSFNKSIYEIFTENLISQGANISSFENKIEEVEKSHSINVFTSEQSGFLNIDLGKLRTFLINLQKDFLNKETRFPDPAGIILKKSTGEFVKNGEILATIRAKAEVVSAFKKNLSSVFTFTHEPVIERTMEVIENV